MSTGVIERCSTEDLCRQKTLAALPINKHTEEPKNSRKCLIFALRTRQAWCRGAHATPCLLGDLLFDRAVPVEHKHMVDYQARFVLLDAALLPQNETLVLLADQHTSTLQHGWTVLQHRLLLNYVVYFC